MAFLDVEIGCIFFLLPVNHEVIGRTGNIVDCKEVGNNDKGELGIKYCKEGVIVFKILGLNIWKHQVDSFLKLKKTEDIGSGPKQKYPKADSPMLHCYYKEQENTLKDSILVLLIGVEFDKFIEIDDEDNEDNHIRHNKRGQ